MNTDEEMFYLGLRSRGTHSHLASQFDRNLILQLRLIESIRARRVGPSVTRAIRRT